MFLNVMETLLHTIKEVVTNDVTASFYVCAQNGRNLTGESPEHGLIVPSA